MGQHSYSGRGGKHRQELLHRHRAPAFPELFATRGRSALSVTALSATLAAGIGAAGVSATAAPLGGTESSPAHHVTAAHPSAALPVEAPSGDTAPGKEFPHGTGVVDDSAGPSGAAVRQKERPVPVAEWVHPLSAAQVTSCFGQRWGRLHAGVDLAAPHGSPIVAAGAGVVVTAGPNGGYGNAVLIDHGNGYLTNYGHMSKIVVEPGQKVTAGQHIGDEGSTGHSTGPHLHFEVHQGFFQNPLEPTAWMHEHGVQIPGCSAATPDAPADSLEK
ncbi:M23 family metallopeptidase [Actinoplanes sp. GCM10030250]|uniref:M23 family metallopeptidase n=1 Tax=Actinoplanes sp. GCM10030250 TaxID=3273376 RepID=UPI00362465EE